MIDYTDRTGIPLETGHLNLKFSLADIEEVKWRTQKREPASQIAYAVNKRKSSDWWVTPSEVQDMCRRNGLLVPVSK